MSAARHPGKGTFARSLLEASEHKYRRLFEAAKDGILILNARTGTIEDVNPFLIGLLGLSKAKLLRKKVWDLGCFRHVVASRERFAELQRNDYVRYEDLPLETADGRQVDVEFVSNVYEVDGSRVIQCNVRNISERKSSEAQLRALTARLLAAREDECLRISRAIHDELGHALTELGLDLVTLNSLLGLDSLPHPKIVALTKTMAQSVEKVTRTVQRIAMDLRPSLLDDLGLMAALEWQVNEFATRTGITCRWLQKPAKFNLTQDQAWVVFRIFQEALNNILRHAGAKRVIFGCPFRSGSQRFTLRDDGRGFDEARLSARNSLGLLGMRERALLIGATVEIESAPTRGTKVTISVPVATPPIKVTAAARRPPRS